MSQKIISQRAKKLDFYKKGENIKLLMNHPKLDTKIRNFAPHL